VAVSPGVRKARVGPGPGPAGLPSGVAVVSSLALSPATSALKMNRKERRLALRTAFQSRAEDLVVVQEFADQLPRPKTQELVAAFSRWGIDAEDKVLLILSERQEMVYLSARNLPNVRLISATNLNVYDLLAADRVVVTAAALEKIQEVYGD
jgi:large subunit ribosomal protein L4